MNALLVIDMQTGSFMPYTLRHDTLAVVQRINSLSAIFRNAGYPVIFIRHDGSRENKFIPGSADWQLLPELVQEASDLLISKTANDAFYGSELQSVLSKLEVSSLFITGCATDFCVDTTIKSAMAKDYQVTVVTDAHTTAERPPLAAEQVIAYYNWLWANMIPTPYPVILLKTAELLPLSSAT
jgi:nicotinamidase-related amidase